MLNLGAAATEHLAPWRTATPAEEKLLRAMPRALGGDARQVSFNRCIALFHYNEVFLLKVSPEEVSLMSARIEPSTPSPKKRAR